MRNIVSVRMREECLERPWMRKRCQCKREDHVKDLNRLRKSMNYIKSFINGTSPTGPQDSFLLPSDRTLLVVCIPHYFLNDGPTFGRASETARM
jgi:hypothetical protein